MDQFAITSIAAGPATQREAASPHNAGCLFAETDTNKQWYSTGRQWIFLASTAGSGTSLPGVTSDGATVAIAAKLNQGDANTVTGIEASAFGTGCTASGDYSHAEGYQTVASGFDAHAEGEQTIASGEGAHAEGNAHEAAGDYSHAEGLATTSSGPNSHAEGIATTASNNGAHAEGSHSTASGDCAHAEGGTTSASGTNSHAEGGSSAASATEAHAEGHFTTASAFYSHSENNNTTAAGYASHAQNSHTEANGSESHASGFNSVAALNSEFAHGFGDFGDGHGKSQYSLHGVKAITVDATLTALLTADGGLSDGSGDSPPGPLTLPANTTWQIIAQVGASRADTPGTVAGWTLRALVTVVGGTARQIGSTDLLAFKDAAASTWAVALNAHGTQLDINVTGEAAKTIRWVAAVHVVQVGV